ncbi:hypothetical protein Mapa_010208 [Marchantia paleacea]|nr:hypothetical protein Mapa_010208 [Marchantia paleacea]
MIIISFLLSLFRGEVKRFCLHIHQLSVFSGASMARSSSFRSASPFLFYSRVQERASGRALIAGPSPGCSLHCKPTRPFRPSHSMRPLPGRSTVFAWAPAHPSFSPAVFSSPHAPSFRPLHSPFILSVQVLFSLYICTCYSPPPAR